MCASVFYVFVHIILFLGQMQSIEINFLQFVLTYLKSRTALQNHVFWLSQRERMEVSGLLFDWATSARNRSAMLEQGGMRMDRVDFACPSSHDWKLEKKTSIQS